MSALRAEAARKALHLLSAAVPLAWAFALVPTAVIRTGLGVALAVAVLVEWLRRVNAAFGARFLSGLGPLLRTHETNHITGATWLAAVMCLSVWMFPPAAAMVALWAAAVGDAMAALVGRFAATLPAVPPARKTLAGSVACAVSTAAGAAWLVHAPLPAALGIGVIAAMAERPRLAVDDNLRVGLAAGAAAWMLLAA